MPKRVPSRCIRGATGELMILDITGNSDGEARSTTEFAFDGDIAAHHATEILAERETKAGPAIFAGGRRLGLIEVLEELLQIVRAYSNAGVADRDSDPVFRIALLTGDLKGHPSILGEFSRVAQKIQDRLAQAGRV